MQPKEGFCTVFILDTGQVQCRQFKIFNFEKLVQKVTLSTHNFRHPPMVLRKMAFGKRSDVR